MFRRSSSAPLPDSALAHSPRGGRAIPSCPSSPILASRRALLAMADFRFPANDVISSSPPALIPLPLAAETGNIDVFGAMHSNSFGETLQQSSFDVNNTFPFPEQATPQATLPADLSSSAYPFHYDFSSNAPLEYTFDLSSLPNDTISSSSELMAWAGDQPLASPTPALGLYGALPTEMPSQKVPLPTECLPFQSQWPASIQTGGFGYSFVSNYESEAEVYSGPASASHPDYFYPFPTNSAAPCIATFSPTFSPVESEDLKPFFKMLPEEDIKLAAPVPYVGYGDFASFLATHNY